MKTRRKRRTTGMDMGPGCFAFQCDPMSMSQKFQTKIWDRRRMGLCPCCGKPRDFCSCKSSHLLKPGEQVIQTHNNKKLRRAINLVKAKEQAFILFSKTDSFFEVLGEEKYDELWGELSNHKLPSIPWKDFEAACLRCGVNADPFKPCWEKM